MHACRKIKTINYANKKHEYLHLDKCNSHDPQKVQIHKNRH